jgi:hypothetical protein
MGEQNEAAVREPGTWMQMHWQDEPHPERVLYLHDETDEGGELPPGAVVYQPATQSVRTVNPSRLNPVPAVPAVQPVAYMVEGAAGDRALIWPGDFRAVHAAGMPSPETVYTPLVPLAAPQAGAAPREVGRCLCDGPAEGYTGPLRERPADLVHRGGSEWQCPRCFGLWCSVGAAPVDAREREEDARWMEQAAAGFERTALASLAPMHRRAAAALRGALPDTRSLEDAVVLALWKAHADATANHTGRILPDFAALPPGAQKTWRRIARAALSGTPEQPAGPTRRSRVALLREAVRARMPRNQCDGCARGLPLEGGIHRGEGYDMIGCTADRYRAVTDPETPASADGGAA